MRKKNDAKNKQKILRTINLHQTIEKFIIAIEITIDKPLERQLSLSHSGKSDNYWEKRSRKGNTRNEAKKIKINNFICSII